MNKLQFNEIDSGIDVFLQQENVGRIAQDVKNLGYYVFYQKNGKPIRSTALQEILQKMEQLEKDWRVNLLAGKIHCPKMQQLELLNSEGPILIAERVGPAYILNFCQDKYQMEVTRRQLAEFLAGIRTICTPDGKIYDYSKFSGSMKPEFINVYNFMKE
jgi:hypothetical protein